MKCNVCWHKTRLVNKMLLLLLLAVGGWPISQPPRAEAVSRPSAQPVSTQRCMRVCVYRHKAEVSAYAYAYACVVSSLCQFILVRRPHCASRPQHWPSCLNRPIQAGESVDQWSRVPTGTMVEQIAPIAAVMNATSVHSLQRTTLNPLSCPGLTPCVSSQSPVPTTPVGEAHDSGQSTSLTQYGAPWMTAPCVVCRTPAASQTLPAPFCPGESRPTTGSLILPFICLVDCYSSTLWLFVCSVLYKCSFLLTYMLTRWVSTYLRSIVMHKITAGYWHS